MVLYKERIVQIYVIVFHFFVFLRHTNKDVVLHS